MISVLAYSLGPHTISKDPGSDSAMLVSAVSRASHSAKSHLMTSPEIPRMLLPALHFEPLLRPKSAPCSVPRSVTMLAFGQWMTRMLTTSADGFAIVHFKRSTTNYKEHHEPNYESGNQAKWWYETDLKGLIGRHKVLLCTCSYQCRACPFGSMALTYMKEKSLKPYSSDLLSIISLEYKTGQTRLLHLKDIGAHHRSRKSGSLLRILSATSITGQILVSKRGGVLHNDQSDLSDLHLQCSC